MEYFEEVDRRPEAILNLRKEGLMLDDISRIAVLEWIPRKTNS